MSPRTSEHKVVVAIDFGTTYSGYGFSLGVDFEIQPTKISSNKPWIASQGLVSHKTPTCVLLKPNKEFMAFGYEAEDRYNIIAEKETHQQYYFFRRFKMILHSRANIQRGTIIEDETGKSMPAIEIFTHGIRYLKEHAVDTIKLAGIQLDELDIHWVLTVPAIWTDGAKQFMREAAQKAGLESNNLSIALEPEAASVYCKYLQSDQLGNVDSKSIFKTDSKYMVIDLGGGTADITVHRVESDETLCEVHGPSGGAWGGTKIDDAFMAFLGELFGYDVVRKFQKKCLEDCIELYRDFELKKRKVGMYMEADTMVVIKIPVALYELYDEHNGYRKLMDSIHSKDELAKYRGKITCTADKMKIDATIMQSFFKKSLDDLVEHIRDILGELPVRGTSTFMVVGGFAESKMVKDFLDRKFPNMQVLVPFDAGLAVLKGAVIFGHAPMVVSSRVCPRTYGMAISRAYVEGRYPQESATLVSGRKIVQNIFHKYMAIGVPTKVGEKVTSLPLSVAKGETHARIRIFSSQYSSPTFVTDEGCSYLGEIIITVPEMEFEQGGTVEVGMTFGGTELHVMAFEKTSGKSYKSRFDFLSS